MKKVCAQLLIISAFSLSSCFVIEELPKNKCYFVEGNFIGDLTKDVNGKKEKITNCGKLSIIKIDFSDFEKADGLDVVEDSLAVNQTYYSINFSRIDEQSKSYEQYHFINLSFLLSDITMYCDENEVYLYPLIHDIKEESKLYYSISWVLRAGQDQYIRYWYDFIKK